jgi:hypothetical protein
MADETVDVLPVSSSWGSCIVGLFLGTASARMSDPGASVGRVCGL